MISVKNSFEIAYNGTENECRFELYADTAAEMVGVTHYDGIKIQMGSEFTDISTGDKYLLNGSGAWILQPSDRAFSNVYTKPEIDSMITEINGIIAYYHTTLVSDTGEITFYSLGGNVGTWAIYGNGQQTGTQTPDNPVMPTFCGERTENLFDKSTITSGIYATLSGTSANNSYYCSDFIPITVATYYFQNVVGGNYQNTVVVYDANKQGLRYAKITGGAKVSGALTFQNGDAYIRVNFYYQTDDDTVMINLGSTAIPYEPYGYKIPITCGGQTNNIYLSAPLRKAIDGSDAVDTIDSAGTITRNVDENGNALVSPTTETVSVPDIPAVQGENTLTVDTTLKPSKIEISGER